MSAHPVTRESKRAAVARRLWLAVSLITLAIPLSGCGTGALWDKFLAKDDTFVDEPADKLYNEGLYLMNQNKDNKAATKKFEEVDRQHPYSVWATRAELMSAYALYQANKYDESIVACNRFIQLHPGHRDVAYAYYLKALDVIGDLALAGRPLLGAYRSFRGGHKLNHAALTALLADRTAWRLVEGEAARRSRTHAEVGRGTVGGMVAPAYGPDVS